jgi:MYXO-CTERM domain-containing protein
MAPVCVSRAIAARPQVIAGLLFVAAGCAMLLPAQNASASIIFSNVQVGGTLAPGVSFITGPSDIDFTMTTTRVGDPTDSIRDGNLVLSYVATNQSIGQMLGIMDVSFLGALAGSGQINFNELILDNVTGATLGSFEAVVTSNSQLPFSHSFPFTPSNQIRVIKSFYLIAMGTPSLDVAQLSAVEQQINTPTPGVLALTGLGGALALRRRRR